MFSRTYQGSYAVKDDDDDDDDAFSTITLYLLCKVKDLVANKDVN